MKDTSTIWDSSHANTEGERMDAADRDEERAERDAEIEAEDRRRGCLTAELNEERRNTKC